MTSLKFTSQKKVLEFFNDADADGDGYLSIKELKTALKKHGYNLSRGKLKQQFEMFDLDGDKRVSRDEFLACMGEIPTAIHQEATIRQMFVAFDIDGNGTIDREELRGVFKAMKRQQMTEMDFDKLMTMVDVNRDGRISYEEFVNFFGKGKRTG